MKVDRKSVKEILENPNLNCYYILVMRYYPFEFRKRKLKLSQTPIDLWDRDLAPSRELLKDLKEKKITWQEYVRRFKKEVPQELVLEKMKKYRLWANGKTITFVCQEEDSNPFCHTWILLKYLADQALIKSNPDP